MNYASFLTADGAATWGVVVDNTIYDLGPTGANLAPSLRAAIDTGVFGNVGDYSQAPSYDKSTVRWLPPVTDSLKVICIGVNYRSHQEEAGKPLPEYPTVFTRFADSQMGHLEPAEMPSTTEKYDYEGELALVISKEAFHVKAEDAFDYVAGYAPYNDFSVRDWQLRASQWIPGKNFPASGAFGPELVPASDVDVNDLVLECRVNGEVRQHAPLNDLIFDIPKIIEYVTGFTRLYPGDVIVTGTPGGVGLFMEPSGLLKEGDVVEVEVTGMPVLSNTVVKVD